MSKARQQQYSQEVRNRILDISQRIISEEGLEALSVRRVANEMDYSAGIIYHYFRDKDHLLSCAVREGYRKILLAVDDPEPGLSPDAKLRESFKNFVESAMLVPHEYRAYMLNSTPDLQAETAILGDGCGEKSPTLAHIVDTLREGIRSGIFAPCDVLLTAKVFWSSIFGLFFRFITEREVSPEQREELIHRQFDILLKGISV